MGKTNALCHLFILLFITGKYIYGTEPSVNTVEENLTNEVSRISNLTINIECNPRQVIKDIKQDIFLLFYRIPNIPIRHYSNVLAQSLYDLKYHLAGIISVGIYSFFLYSVSKGNAYLSSIKSWSRWKEEMPLNDLLATPAHSLSQDLILEIQRRYTSAEAPTDFISSLITFIKDIDHEIITIKRYNNLISWLKKLHISALFPIKNKLVAKIPEILNRLSYIRNIFLTWAAQYKIDQHKRYCIS